MTSIDNATGLHIAVLKINAILFLFYYLTLLKEVITSLKKLFNDILMYSLSSSDKLFFINTTKKLLEYFLFTQSLEILTVKTLVYIFCQRKKIKILVQRVFHNKCTSNNVQMYKCIKHIQKYI